MRDVITIDGPAGSGKSTVAKILAKKLGYTYLDTGAMYRAVALLVKEKGISLEDRSLLKKVCESMKIRFVYQGEEQRIFLEERDISEEIRTSEIDLLSSDVSSIREVRDVMTALQRKIAENHNLVAEGRDMGTVVFPNARIKFFLTASFDTRVMRRYTERKNKGEDISLERIKEELAKRDAQDQSRSLAPLKPAEDAVIIDTSQLSIKEVVDKMLFYIEKS
jgi:cytidylate kinase